MGGDIARREFGKLSNAPSLDRVLYARMEKLYFVLHLHDDVSTGRLSV